MCYLPELLNGWFVMISFFLLTILAFIALLLLWLIEPEQTAIAVKAGILIVFVYAMLVAIV